MSWDQAFEEWWDGLEHPPVGFDAGILKLWARRGFEAGFEAGAQSQEADE